METNYTNKGNTAVLDKCTFNILDTIIAINWTYIYIHSSDLYINDCQDNKRNHAETIYMLLLCK